MFDKLNSFIKVAETLSFSKAAKQLNMAPSSISRKIDSLECELAVTLFKRSTRQLILTDNGSIFLEGAKKLLPQVNDLIVSVQNKTDEVTGTIKISVFESFGRLHVCSIISSFVKKHPKINIEIELENRIVDLLTEDVDIAIRVGKPKDSGLRARKLTSNKAILCASPEYLKKHGRPETPTDIQKHNCLLLSKKRQYNYWYFRQEEKYEKILVKGNVSSTGGSPLLESAEGGAGILLLAHWMVSRSIKEGKLEYIDLKWESSLNSDFSGEVYAVFHNNKYINPALRAFIDHLVNNIQI
jgi:DNA-binding transcriptional LysR family regulator